MVLLADVDRPDAAAHLAARLVDALAPGYRLGGAEVRLDVSVGVVMLDDAAVSPDEILRRADRAMYRAKDAGGGRVELGAG